MRRAHGHGGARACLLVGVMRIRKFKRHPRRFWRKDCHPVATEAPEENEAWSALRASERLLDEVQNSTIVRDLEAKRVESISSNFLPTVWFEGVQKRLARASVASAMAITAAAVPLIVLATF